MGDFFSSQGAGILKAFVGLGAARTKSRVARQEAEVMFQEAEFEKDKTRIQIRDFSELVEANVGRAAALTGASGFDSTSKSAEAAINAIIRRGELDKSNIRVAGQLRRNKALYEGRHLAKSADAADTLALFSAATDSFNLFQAFKKD